MFILHRRITTAAVIMAVAFSPLAIPAAQARSATQMTAQGEDALNKLEARAEFAPLRALSSGGSGLPADLSRMEWCLALKAATGYCWSTVARTRFTTCAVGHGELQIGGEKLSYANLFMNDASLNYLRKSDGFAAGMGPSIAVINKGAAAEENTTTITKDVYAFPSTRRA